MELAIPLVALGGMYVISGQNKSKDSSNKKKQLANIRYTRLSTLLYMVALYKKNHILNLI